MWVKETIWVKAAWVTLLSFQMYPSTNFFLILLKWLTVQPSYPLKKCLQMFCGPFFDDCGRTVDLAKRKYKYEGEKSQLFMMCLCFCRSWTLWTMTKSTMPHTERISMWRCRRLQTWLLRVRQCYWLTLKTVWCCPSMLLTYTKNCVMLSVYKRQLKQEAPQARLIAVE